MSLIDKMAAPPTVIYDGKKEERARKTAARQARHRNRLAEKGIVAVTVRIPREAAAEFKIAADALREAPHLRLGLLQDPISGKFVSIRHPKDSR